MKKALVILTILVAASWASAETIWGIQDGYVSAPEAYISAFDSATGAGISAPVFIPQIAHTYGLAVTGNTAYISAEYADANTYLVTYDLTTHSITSAVATNYIRGLTMSLDGATLYGVDVNSSEVVTINPATGAVTSIGAALPAAYPASYWACLPGIDPTSGDFWVESSSYRYSKWAGGISASAAVYDNRYFDDQTSAVCFDSAGNLMQSKVFNGTINIAIGDPDVMTGLGQQSSTINPVSTNGWTTSGGAYWGLSPVFPEIPEPATMGLLLVGGLGALLRKRR